MQIQREPSSEHTITSYGEEQLTINGTTYHNSLIVSAEMIISPWNVHGINDLTQDSIDPFIKQNPEVILIGTTATPKPLCFELLQWLSQQRIGVEVMTLGAACRTYNLLLSEHRRVIAGLILE